MSSYFDRSPNRRIPGGLNKWTWYPPDVIPMWIADMDFRSPPPVLAALRGVIDRGVLGYEFSPRALHETVAARLRRLYRWDVDPDWVVAVTGTVSGFNVAARALCNQKRGYLIQPPVYNEFHAITGDLGVPQYEAPLLQRVRDSILDYQVDWDAFRKQVKKARMFLLCSPHNPVGKVFSRADLRRMAEICLEHGVTIVADEIHSELLLGEQKFTPMATLSKAVADASITLVSPSKTFNIPGLLCGFAIIPDPGLRASYVRVVERLRMHVNSMGLFAARAALSGECDEWLVEVRSYLTRNRDFLVEYVMEHLPDIRATRPAATYLAWLDCGGLVRRGVIPGSPFDFFMNEAKVAFADGRIYGAASADFVRLNFGCTRRTLEQALDRVRDSLYRRKHG